MRIRSIAPALLLLLSLTTLEVRAATLTVTTTADAGPGSLRAALAAAAASGDTIVFAPALAGQTIVLTTSDVACVGTTDLAAPFGPTALVVDGKDVTIDGRDAPGLALSANDLRRLFAVTGAGGSGELPRPPAAGRLRLVGLTLTRGWRSGVVLRRQQAHVGRRCSGPRRRRLRRRGEPAGPHRLPGPRLRGPGRPGRQQRQQRPVAPPSAARWRGALGPAPGPPGPPAGPARRPAQRRHE